MQSIGSPSAQIIRGVAVASRTAFQDVGADHRRLHGPVALERTPSHNRRRGASRKTFDCSDPFFRSSRIALATWQMGLDVQLLFVRYFMSLFHSSGAGR
jgi:hypothetical protein